MTDSCVTLLQEKESTSTTTGKSSEMVVFTSEIPVVKQEVTETSCNMISQENTVHLPITSGYAEHSFVEVRAQDDVLNIQITNVHGSLPIQNGPEEEITILGKQTENQMNACSDKQHRELKSSFRYSTHGNISMAQELYRDREFVKDKVTQKENQLRSPASQTRFYNGIQLADTAEQENEILYHSRSSTEEVSSAANHPAGSSPTVLSAFQADNEYSLPVYQMGINKAMRANQFDTQNGAHETASTYKSGTSEVPSSAAENLQETVPLYHVDTEAETAALQTGVMEGDPRYQVRNYQPEVPSLHGVDNFRESLKFNQTQIPDAGLNYNVNTVYKCCKCGCHSLNQSNPYYVLPPGLESQRPSVIMVPVSWNSIASGTSHLPLKANTPYSLTSRNWRNGFNTMGQQIESDSSDDDDEERAENYFRWNIDGTTARFKLSREDWERIPINTFPSGGRLLSGDWTRIFIEKVKESNPWCSLRFKNNHVRSENSRKIHSAVFFRGGAECKRPECNVKVRFVIQKERGKYVDVTYLGNVCHSSRPGVSDCASGRIKRVRRTNSS